MARPKKLNADYFPHDVDMRNDLKIKALRTKFGFKGYACWCMMLEHLGNSNYFEYEWNELNIELLSTDFLISSEELIEFVEYCIKLELLQIENGYLTCEKFSNRLTNVFSGKREEFSMETSKRKGLRNGNYTEMKFTERKPSDNPESKVKESKVKESEVKESKVKETKVHEIDTFTFTDKLRNLIDSKILDVIIDSDVDTDSKVWKDMIYNYTELGGFTKISEIMEWDESVKTNWKRKFINYGLN
jgi:hypothetical protein